MEEKKKVLQLQNGHFLFFFFLEEIMMIRSTLSIIMNVLFKIQEILGTPDRLC